MNISISWVPVGAKKTCLFHFPPPGALQDQPGQVSLHTDHLNVHEVPGNCLQHLLQGHFKIYFLLSEIVFVHLKFGSFNVQDEPVHCGMAHCSQERIQGHTLQEEVIRIQ